MWSCSRSAFDPSSVTTVPFKVTRPSTMIFSDCRRDAMPAWDRIFWSRSSGILSLPLVGGGIGRYDRLFRLRFRFRLGRGGLRLEGGGRRIVRERHAPDLL